MLYRILEVFSPISQCLNANFRTPTAMPSKSEEIMVAKGKSKSSNLLLFSTVLATCSLNSRRSLLLLWLDTTFLGRPRFVGFSSSPPSALYLPLTLGMLTGAPALSASMSS
jgi:hypothetical protein